MPLTCINNVRLEPATGQQQTPLCAEAEHMLHILDNVAGFVFATDREGRIQLHRGLAAHLGGPPGRELMGCCAFEVFEHLAPLVDGLRRTLTGERVTRECEFGERVFEASLQPLLNAAGETVGAAGVAVDVTERRKAEEAHRRTNQMLEAMVRSSPIGMATLDLKGIVTLWNPAAERIHGWLAEEVLGRTLLMLPERMPDQVSQEFTDFEQVCKRKDGDPILVSWSAASLHAAGGEITGVLYLMTDVTERKRVADEMQQATRLAEAASRAKSEFLANMSHEIRTPLNGVLGLLELALGTALTEEQQEYLNFAKISAKSLLSVLNDVLDFSRIEARKLTLEHIEFDLQSVLEDVGRTMAIGADQKRLALTFQVDAQVPNLLVGDACRVRQILVNLVGNALKFTHQGEVLVRVAVARESQDTSVLRFEVEDTGIGLSPSRAQAIFAPFVQADGGTTRKYGGTGLGLTICKELALLMKGQIGVESIPGKGSTFWFTIECAKQDPGRAGFESRSLCLSGLKVLVADEHDSNLRVTAELLRRLGCKVSEAANWKAAEKLLLDAVTGGEPFRTALLDARLAGVGVAGSGRFGGALPILMTCLGDRLETNQRDGNPAAHIVKPIFAQALREVLTRVCGCQPLLTQPSTSSSSQDEACRPTAIFDSRAMLERLVGDNELAGRMIGGFLEDVPRQIKDLTHKVEMGDASGANRQARSLRGAAGILSAEKFSATAGRIEQAALCGEMTQAAGYTHQLEEQLEELRIALERSGWV